MEEIEQTEGLENTDVEQPSSEAPEPETNAAPTKEAAQPKELEIDWAKAFEHPRFKELNSQRNEAVEQARALKSQIDALQGQFKEFQTPRGPTKDQTEFESLISDLKKVDPRLAAVIEANQSATKELQALKQQQQTFTQQYEEAQRQATVKETVAKINQFHEANKLTPEVRELINAKLDNLYMQGKLNPQNIDSEYKSQLDGFNKFIETLKRTERESYVKEKKADSSVPASQPKGTPAKPAPKKPNWSKDPEQARQQIVNKYLKQSAANKEADAV